MSKPRRSRSAPASGHQVGPGTVVSCAYELFDAEGEKVEESEPGSSLEFLIGFGTVAPAIERALEGLSEGARRDLKLRPDEAYGPRDPGALIEVDRTDLPESLEPGDELLADREDGQGQVLLKVVDLRDDVAVLDTNHPLAGQQIRLVLTVRSVRPATDEEIREATQRLERATAAPEAPLLPAERLLRRVPRDEPAGGEIPSRPPRIA